VTLSLECERLLVINSKPTFAALFHHLASPDEITPEAAADLASLGIDYQHERALEEQYGLQGKLNTWFIGSYTSFESVADVLDYNLKLVNEHLYEN